MTLLRAVLADITTLEVDAIVNACYEQCLKLASVHRARSIAFPAISTGIYGYPVADAARVAVRTARRVAKTLEHAPREIVFCCFSADHLACYEAELAAPGAAN